MALVKAGQRNHDRVREAVEVCQAAMKSGEVVDVYSNGLALIFLCEYGNGSYRNEVEYYLDMLSKRQKDHGGWGYDEFGTGDTSQTQYGTFGYWQAIQKGYRPDRSSVEGVADWLLRTQDPDGCWGYQGQVASSNALTIQSDKSVSMLVAGLGSLLICSDILNVYPSKGIISDEKANGLPPGLRRAGEVDPALGRSQAPSRAISQQRVDQAVRNASEWFAKNYTVEFGQYTGYYLYSMERYKSFEEYLAGNVDPEPKWYNDGFEFLKSKQKQDGSWHFGLGDEIDTSFAILFLVRSTKRSLGTVTSEGTLLGGRGLPSNIARAKIRGGQVVADQVQTTLDGLFTMIDSGEQASLDDLVDDPSFLIIEQVDDKSVRRLKQLVRGGEWNARLLAVRALARTGDLDHVPSLLFALTDPDPRVVREARNGLEFVSRRFDGFGPPDEFDEDQRHEAITKWKDWYQGVRPDALLEH
jgi:hypothetical protein